MASTTMKVNYPAESTITITLASLGTSSTFVAGRESTAIDNTTNLYLDYLISGKITVGTTPTINTQIRVYVFSPVGASSAWPDVMDGTDSAETITSVGVGQGFLKQAAVLNVDATTSDREYPFGMVSLAQLFGGWCPPKFGVFVTHNTGVNLNSTGGNHYILITPVRVTGET